MICKIYASGIHTNNTKHNWLSKNVLSVLRLLSARVYTGRSVTLMWIYHLTTDDVMILIHYDTFLFQSCGYD